MALPGDISLVTINETFYFTDASFWPTSATVKFTPTAVILRDPSDGMVAQKTVVCTVNASGKLVGPVGAQGAGDIGVVLPATDDPDLLETGYAYTVEITIPGGPTVPTFMVPLPSTPSTVRLADLVPVIVLPVVGAPITQAQGDARYQRFFAPVTLSVSAGNIDTNAALGYLFRCTLGAHATLTDPTNPTDGQKIEWQLRQDATGGRTLTLGSKFRLNSDIGAVVLSTAINKLDSLVAQYYLADDKWDVLGLVKGA